MIHLVFNRDEVELMKKVQELDSTLEGDILLIRDDYAVGPYWKNIYETEGYQKRRDWWMALLKGLQ